MKRYVSRSILMLTFAAVPATAFASVQADSLVVLKCVSTDDTSKKIAGSGVIVSDRGHVLTSVHVAPDGYSCEGAVGEGRQPNLPLETGRKTRSGAKMASEA